MKIELIIEIKIICQNFRLIGAIYCDNIGDFVSVGNKMADILPLSNSLYPSLKMNEYDLPAKVTVLPAADLGISETPTLSLS